MSEQVSLQFTQFHLIPLSRPGNQPTIYRSGNDNLSDVTSGTSSFRHATYSRMDVDGQLINMLDSEDCPLRRLDRIGMSARRVPGRYEDDFADSHGEPPISLTTRTERGVASILHLSELEKLPIEVSSLFLLFSLRFGPNIHLASREDCGLSDRQ